MKATTRRLLEIYGVGTDARPHDQELDEQGDEGLRITGDQSTMGRLLEVFKAFEGSGDQWLDDCASALEQAVQSGRGNATLPKFQGQAGDGTNGEEETP